MIDIMVRNSFTNFIKKTFKDKYQLQRFFLNHERRQLVQDNLVKEIRLCELKGKKLDRKTIDEMVQNMTRLFCKVSLNHKQMEITNKFQAKKTVDEHGEEIQIEEDKPPELPEGVLEIDRVTNEIIREG